jgi:hypothetical protein
MGGIPIAGAKRRAIDDRACSGGVRPTAWWLTLTKSDRLVSIFIPSLQRPDPLARMRLPIAGASKTPEAAGRRV